MRFRSGVKPLIILLFFTGSIYVYTYYGFLDRTNKNLGYKDAEPEHGQMLRKANFQMYDYDSKAISSTALGQGDQYDTMTEDTEMDYAKDPYALFSHKYIASFERFNVGSVELEFLDDFKSPCWVEETDSSNFTYNDNRMVTGPRYTKKGCFEEGLMKSKPVFVQLEGQDHPFRVRCLPYFMLLGVAKSGTSDLQYRIIKSHYVFKSFSKELYWWNQYRFNPNATLSDYSDLFDFGMKDLVKLKTQSNGVSPIYPGVMGEMTSITLSDVSYWREDPRNEGLKEPKYLTPHDLYGVLPGVKLIVLMRNPTTRLYSHYNMWSGVRKINKTAEDFHSRVVNSVAWWRSCVEVLPERGCLYGSPPEMPPVENTLSSWWPKEVNYTGELRTGLYSLFLKDWLSVFPKENFLFIKSEEYKVNQAGILTEEVLPFLGVPPLLEDEVENVDGLENVFQTSYEPMLPKTKELLDQFYQPFNNRLADLLEDEKWMWKD